MDCLPQLHLAAYHAEAGYNNDTPGIGLLCNYAPDWQLAIGTYFNSIRQQSNYAGLAWQPFAVAGVKLGAFAGLVTGYQEHAIPFAAGVVSLSLGEVALHLLLIPPVPTITPATAEISVTYRF